MHRNNFFCDWLYSVFITRTSMLAIALSFAAGAILVMLGESMIPEAYEQGGASIVGLGILVGLSLAFILGNV
jgi:ZIP family zinc transporter